MSAAALRSFVFAAAVALAPPAPGVEPVYAPAPAAAPGLLAQTRAALTAFPDGPAVATIQPQDLARSCEQLYYERVVLMQRARPFAPAFYDDPRNQAAVFLGSVATPFYYLWGYTAVESYYDARRVEAVDRRLDVLRQVAAHKDCFVRR